MLRIGNVWHYLDKDGTPLAHAEHDTYFDGLVAGGTLVPVEKVHLAISTRTGELTQVTDGSDIPPDYKLIFAPMGLYVL
jgi:hypothetical protein